MAKEVKGEVMVQVSLEILWKAFTEKLSILLPRVAPNLVSKVELLEGDGGLGTVLLIHYGHDVHLTTYQKEKIIEVAEAHHRLGVEVVEGGHLTKGFASYKVFFQFSRLAETDSLVEAIVVYEMQDGVEESSFPVKTLESSLAFIKHVEAYLLKNEL